MSKCPYCARPLRMGGIRCRACRRFIFSWPHIVVLVLLALAATVAVLEFLYRLD
ncbi:MAG TPA: hypothetical protein VGX48_04245 [Pyrinomonadaceae bacterium]|nr:hypothetical protein [Pyrinomonadaceae bacterium]